MEKENNMHNIVRVHIHIRGCIICFCLLCSKVKATRRQQMGYSFSSPLSVRKILRLLLPYVFHLKRFIVVFTVFDFYFSSSFFMLLYSVALLVKDIAHAVQQISLSMYGHFFALCDLIFFSSLQSCLSLCC